MRKTLFLILSAAMLYGMLSPSLMAYPLHQAPVARPWLDSPALESDTARLFVGNLPWSVGNAELEEFFGQHGEVLSAYVVVDRESGRSRGFGFVTIVTDNALALIQATDGYEVDGRLMRVTEAEERP